MRGIRRIPCGNVNCYLVQGEEGAVLVDTGYTGYVELLLDTCLGAGVRLIVLTHGHLDHIQNTALLMERLGGGGNHSAAGAQLKNTTPEEADRLITEAIRGYLEDQRAEKQNEHP